MNDRLLNRMLEVSRAIFDKDTHDHRCFIASGAFYKGKLIAIETNKPKYHKFNKINLRFGRTGLFIKSGTCAEAALITRLKRLTCIPFSKIEIVNVRFNKLGEASESKPCGSCQKALNHFVFKSLHYTNEFGKFVEYS